MMQKYPNAKNSKKLHLSYCLTINRVDIIATPSNQLNLSNRLC
ncbi:hypothetical protein BCLUESOX_405 [bacterium endosymbiont of Bathymodiolus sp. 5 South]|nr:hypothetical protein [uncultured Gammaproteobacteria bacterium]SHN93187.1 hypothetical protein BCLUESOX_405 [bacterium endosymbiont of Bathymodiolus sp. 5 South]